MKHPIQIRTAAQADISLLARLIRDSFSNVAERYGLNRQNCPKHPSNCSDQWVARDMDRGVVYYILEESGLAKGCVAIEQADANQCYLERLAVLPQFRKAGLGRALVMHVLDRARALDAEQVGIGIMDQDTTLKSWYARLGFVETHTKTFAHLPFCVAFMKCAL